MVGFDSTKEYKRRRFNPCSTYADCMEELKKRVSVVNGFLTGKCSAMYVQTTSESVCLQIRKILELIALGSLCVNRTEYEKYRRNFHLDWHGRRILETLEKQIRSSIRNQVYRYWTKQPARFCRSSTLSRGFLRKRIT